MPRPEILEALGMTAAEWGQLSPTDGTRTAMTEKALRILKGEEPKISSAENRAIALIEADLKNEKEQTLTRAGFQEAMVQQAKFFGDAVAELREGYKQVYDVMVDYKKRIEALEKLILPKKEPEKEPAKTTNETTAAVETKPAT